MIKLNFPRNEQGLYIIPKDLDMSRVVMNTADILAKSNNFWYETDNNEKILMKFDPQDSSVMTLCGEILFSKIAENNNYQSAKIDVARLESGEFVTLSKNVVDDNAEPLYSNTIFSYYGYSYGERIPTVENVYRLVEAYAYDNNLKLDKKLKNKLYKMAIVDFLVNQDDRNFDNFMFQIKDVDGEKIIELCDIFDNEGVFGFLQLAFEENINKIFDSAKITDEEKKSINKSLNSVLHNSKNNDLTANVFGIETDIQGIVQSYNLYETLYDSRKNQRAKKIFYDELSDVLLNNNELMEFFSTFKYDAKEVGEQIKKETGFKIPTVLLQLTQIQFDFRRQEIINAIENKIENERGEE